TTVAFTAGERTISVPIGVNQQMTFSEIGATVTPMGDGRWRIEVEMEGEPEQVTVDPERILLDANPGDNYWKAPIRTKVTPLYTVVDDTDIASDFDKLNCVAGPWMWGASYQDPWYTRSTMFGLRAGVNRPQHYRTGIYAAYRTDYRDMIVGADATLLGDHTEA